MVHMGENCFCQHEFKRFDYFFFAIFNETIHRFSSFLVFITCFSVHSFFFLLLLFFTIFGCTAKGKRNFFSFAVSMQFAKLFVNVRFTTNGEREIWVYRIYSIEDTKHSFLLIYLWTKYMNVIVLFDTACIPCSWVEPIDAS